MAERPERKAKPVRNSRKTTGGERPAARTKPDAKLGLELLEGLLEEVPSKLSAASKRLRSLLTGVITIHFTKSDERLVVSGKAEELTSERVAAKGKAPKSDCVIHLAETDFENILSGKLNPQVAMLSDKILVEGNPSLAVYFFNLFVPGEGSR